MAGTVVHLDRGVAFDPKEHFRGPWRSIARTVIPAGDTVVIEAAQTESFIYVMAGDGALEVDHRRFALQVGLSVTVILGSTASIQAGPAGLEIFRCDVAA